MNEFSAVSADEINQVEGGIVPIIAAGVILLAGGCIGDLEEAGEPLPGFDAFLAETRRISRLR